MKSLEKGNETLRRTLHLLCHIFAQNAKSERDHEETADKTKLRSIPTNWSVFLKKKCQGHERQRSEHYSRQETKEM